MKGTSNVVADYVSRM